ncbi:MAG TPA: 4-oxalocrotonate decarboxylase [Noviherbaspirillum sp.]|jgi:2-keto-4-pentenoate hydratase|uniref:2-keto-4-pentenoate hydratase n=1 Tax=Noviherbaspirillum sp. TaxID=1926288 RepID=UPI002DDD9366|nr:4-oxalocrotonate decarboxylase [Noviherbaspirillum sp.]HEV2613055.1 4-oxalocrotonate decarboxylase [Noviherbaspirillum sp.]
MLMSTQANRYALQLLEARADVRMISPLSAQTKLTTEDGYDIVKSTYDIRTAQGEVMIGRKIGFANRKIWAKYGVEEPISTPIWTPMFDSTVRYTNDNRGIQSLFGALQPRLGPEVVFKLGTTPSPDATIEELAECIEWMAHAFEIVVCPFEGWKFEMVDSIAAFGLHGSLIVGEPKVLSSATRRNLDSMLAYSSLSLSCGDELRSAGFGSDVLGSPLQALWHLHEMLKTQPRFDKLSAGEIITTGTWTDVCPIAPGETWTSAFSGVSLPGLTVSFV